MVIMILKLAVGCFALGTILSGVALVMALTKPKSSSIVGRGETPALIEPAESAPAPEVRPSHSELLRQLQVEADKHHVYWKVFCTAFYEGDEDKYSAIATKGKPFNIYIEEGADKHWFVSNLNTQDDAAWALLRALRLPPNSTPQHKDVRKKVECKQDLEGKPAHATASARSTTAE